MIEQVTCHGPEIGHRCHVARGRFGGEEDAARGVISGPNGRRFALDSTEALRLDRLGDGTRGGAGIRSAEGPVEGVAESKGPGSKRVRASRRPKRFRERYDFSDRAGIVPECLEECGRPSSGVVRSYHRPSAAISLIQTSASIAPWFGSALDYIERVRALRWAGNSSCYSSNRGRECRKA